MNISLIELNCRVSSIRKRAFLLLEVKHLFGFFYSIPYELLHIKRKLFFHRSYNFPVLVKVTTFSSSILSLVQILLIKLEHLLDRLIRYFYSFSSIFFAPTYVNSLFYDLSLRDQIIAGMRTKDKRPPLKDNVA